MFVPHKLQGLDSYVLCSVTKNCNFIVKKIKKVFVKDYSMKEPESRPEAKNPNPENQIIQRIRAGEKQLFEVLVHQNNQRLYRVLRGYLKNEEDIKDVLQNTYLKAYLNLDQFHGQASFSTWLIKIGINEALKRLKKLKSKREFFAGMNNSTNTNAPNSGIFYTNPEKRMLLHETVELIEHALDQLPEKYRVVFILRELEGFDISTSAEMLQLTEDNVRVRLHRAKNLLKEELYKHSTQNPYFQFGGSKCHEVRQHVMGKIWEL